MYKKNNVPSVCAAMLIGIVAYSNLMTMDVQAAQADDADTDNVTNDLESGKEDTNESHEVTNTTEEITDENTGETKSIDVTIYDNKDDFDEAADKITDSIPSDATSSVDTENPNSVKYEWTDENGYTHTMDVETNTVDKVDSDTTVTITEGSTQYTEYPELVFDHEEEDGTKVYIKGETVTTTDKVQITHNDNESAEVHVTETIDTNEKVLDYPKTDPVSVYDSDGNVIDKIASEDKPDIPLYDEQGNEITGEGSITVGEWEQVKDENGNLLYEDEAGNITTDKSHTKTSTTTETPTTTTTVNVTDAGIYGDDEDLTQIKGLLGDYGITGQEVEIREAQTGINAGTIISNRGQAGTDNGVLYLGDNDEYKDSGNEMRFETIADGTSIQIKGHINQIILGSDYADYDEDEFEKAFVSAGVGHQGTVITWENQSNRNYTVENPDDTVLTVEETRKQVADLADAIMDKAGKDENTIGVVNNKLDFTNIINNTSDEVNYDVVYATVSLNSYEIINNDSKVVNKGTLDGFQSASSMHIYMNDDQIIVINVDTSSYEDTSTVEIDLQKFEVYVNTINGLVNYSSDSGDGKLITQQIVFNFGSFNGTINTAGSIIGTIIAPNATIYNYSTSCGQIICNSYINKSGEWHYTGTSVEREIVEKEVNTDTTTKEVANTPLWTINATKTENIYKDKEPITKEYAIKWSSSDKVTVSGGESLVEYTYETVKPTITETPTPDPETPPEITQDPTPDPETPPVITENPTPDPETPPVITEDPTENPETPPVITEDPTPDPETPPVTPETPTVKPPVKPKKPTATTSSSDDDTDTSPETPSETVETPTPTVTVIPEVEAQAELVDISEDTVPMAASIPSKTSGLTDIYDEPTAMASTFMPKTYDNSQLVTTLCILTAVASAVAGIFTFMKRKD